MRDPADYPCMVWTVTFWPGTKNDKGELKYFHSDGIADLGLAAMAADPVEFLVGESRFGVSTLVAQMREQGDFPPKATP